MLKYALKYKGLLMTCVVVTLLNSALNVGLAFVIQQVVDTAVSKNVALFIQVAFWALVYFLCQEVVFFVLRVLQSFYLKKVMIHFKSDFLSRLVHLDLEVIQQNKASKFISLLTNDVSMMEEDYFKSMIVISSEMFLFIFALVGLFKLNATIALSLMVISWLPLLMPRLFENHLKEKKRLVSSSLENHTDMVKDIFNGIREIHLNQGLDFYEKKYRQVNQRLESDRFKSQLGNIVADSLSQTMSSLMLIGVVAVSGYFILIGQMTVGSLLGVLQLMNYVTSPLLYMVASKNKMNAVKGIYESIENLLEEKNVSDKASKVMEKTAFDFQRPIIEFKSVSFKYPETQMGLEDVSLSVESGKKYLIMGKSGSGKSTFLNLILKNISDYEGEINFYGVDLKTLDRTLLYEKIATVFQKNHMFNDSIYNNICLGKVVDEITYESALERGQIKTLINQQPTNSEGILFENGANISGGEAQRIAIARSLVVRKPLLLLDEAFSSLDHETYRKVEAKILELENQTLISVSHKSTQAHLDQYDYVWVFDSGKLVAVTSASEFKMPKHM